MKSFCVLIKWKNIDIYINDLLCLLLILVKKMREFNVRLDINIKYYKYVLFYIWEMFLRFVGVLWLWLVVKIND